MKDNKRGVRRAHRERMVQCAYRKFKAWTWCAETYTDSEIKERASRLADHMKNCSCWMCGNPRKYNQGQAELTQQELRQANNLKEGLDEYFETNDKR